MNMAALMRLAIFHRNAQDLIPALGDLSRSMRIVAVLVVLYPVTLISNLAVFGPASAFATAGCYLLAAALLLQLGTSRESWSFPTDTVWTNVNFGGLIYSMPMICFVYAFHYVLTDTLLEVENPSPHRLALVSFSTVVVLIGCYLPVSISGYLLLSGESIPSNVLSGLPPGAPIVFLAKLSIGLLLFVTYSLFIIPLRRRLEEIIFNTQTRLFVDPRRLLIAAVLAGLIGITSIALPDLGLANSLAGGCIALVMFYFPGRLMIRGRQMDLPLIERDRSNVLFGAFFVFMGVLICVMGLFGNLIFSFE